MSKKWSITERLKLAECVICHFSDKEYGKQLRCHWSDKKSELCDKIKKCGNFSDWFDEI